MADYYVDHGAYGLAANRLGLDAPTWGVPQEGDGTSKDAATASSTGSILFGSVPTSGTITVCGAPVSTTGVIGAASVDAAANALATNINATTNAVSTTFANTGCPTNANRLQNIVYARGPAGGAPAGTCQIMSRIGSASHNATAIATNFDGSPTLTQFTGGSGGCWGWFLNSGALGVSSGIGAALYGAFLYVPLVGAIPTITDNVYVRTGGGASKTIDWTYTTSTTLIHANYNKTLVFDTNTQWTGDVATGKVHLRANQNEWNINSSIRFSYPGISTSYKALAEGGFELELISSQAQGSFAISSSNNNGAGHARFHAANITFRDSSTSFAMNAQESGSTGAVSSRLWENCKWLVTTPRATVITPIFSFAGYLTNIDHRYVGCIFDFNISGVGDPGVIATTAYQNESDVVFQNCSFLGFASGYRLMTAGAWATSGVRLSVTVDNCSGLVMPSSRYGFPVSTSFIRQGVHQVVFSNANLASQAGMRIEDCRGVAEWLPDDPTPFPYLSATLPGSGDPYSVRLIWVRAVPLQRSTSYESPDFRMFTQLAAAARTLTLQVFMPSTVTDNIKASFAYIDSTGVSRREDVEAISSSAASWTNAGSYFGYVAKKFIVTTAYSVKANSEIIATVQLFGAPPGSDATVNVYVDPEFTVE